MLEPPLDALDLIGVFALTAIAAFTQAVSGFGFSLFIVPPLSILLGPAEAVVTANFLSFSVNVPVTVQNRSEVDWRIGLRLLLAAAFGMPIGLLILLAVDATTLRVIIAIAVLVSTVLVWQRVPIGRPGRVGDAGAGFVSGVLNTSTGMSGPPVVLHLQARALEPGRFRASLAAYFLATSASAVALFAASGEAKPEHLAYTAAGIPGIAVGVWAGNRVFRRLSGERFRAIVIVVLVLSALIALATAL